MYSLAAGCLSRGSLGTVVTVVMMVVAVMMGLPGLKCFSTFTNRLRNDGCNSSSSDNECNGKLDLDHFD